MKGGSRETKEQKGAGGGRTGYGKREVVTPLSPHHGKITTRRQLAALTILLLCLIGEDRFQSFASLRKKFPLILCFSVFFRL